MKRAFLLTFFLLTLPCGLRLAVGQAAPTATAPGAYVSVGATYSVFQSDYGGRVLGGAGLFVDINPWKQVGIEGEARWLRQNNIANTTETTYLVGPRVEIRRHRFSPYIKTLVGVGFFNFPYNYAKGKYFVIAPGAGVNYNLTDNVKIRLVDVEYQNWPQFTFGNITPYGVSVGISYHFFNGANGNYKHPRW